jgi:lysozyme
MSKPQAPETLIKQYLTEAGLLTASEPCALLGVRGYYRDSKGVEGRNDVGIYDDAMFFIAPGVFLAVNANTDPSRLGWNAGVGKEFAMLMPGTWYFIRGAHKGKVPALRQADEDQADDVKIPNHGHFKVWRAKGMEAVLAGTARVDDNYHAINIHRGGENTTSSWGCQTIPPEQFEGFMLSVWEHTKKHSQERIPYRLIDGPIN